MSRRILVMPRFTPQMLASRGLEFLGVRITEFQFRQMIASGQAESFFWNAATKEDLEELEKALDVRIKQHEHPYIRLVEGDQIIWVTKDGRRTATPKFRYTQLTIRKIHHESGQQLGLDLQRSA